MLFAATTILAYVLIEVAMMPLLGQPISSLLTVSVGLWLSVKAAGALLGAKLGSGRRASSSEIVRAV